MADILEFKKPQQPPKPRQAWTCFVCGGECQEFKILDDMRVECANCGHKSDLIFATHQEPIDEEGEYRGG
jgi:DNA-directed RNA polymerase subunit RPC12/RpoP